MQSIDLEKIERIVEPIVKSKGYELIACELVFEEGRRILRVFIDKEGGVNLEDCSEISYLLSPLLDVENLISGSYHLEISSPGLDRPLKKLIDFKQYVGHSIRLRTKSPLEGRSHFKGILKQVEGQKILIQVDHQLFQIPHELIQKARLEVNWDEVLKKGKK